MRIVSIRLFLAIICFIQVSCLNKTVKKKYVIGFSQCVEADKWRQAMLEGMKRELAFYDNITFIYKEADNNSNKQIEQVNELLNQKIDLLIISPNEAKPLTPIVETVFKKGIPVIVIDRKVTSSSYTAYIGADNYEVGKIAGAYAVNLLNNKGTITEIGGLPGSSPAIERHNGFMDALKNHPDVQVTNHVPGDWLREKSFDEVYKNADNIVKSNLVFAHNDMMAIAAKEALFKKYPDNKVKIIGIDALSGKDAGIDFIAEKKIDASALYPTGGEDAIRLALKILNKESFQKENILNTLIVDSTNVRLMKFQTEKIGSQQQDIQKQQDLIEEQKRIYNNQKTFTAILSAALLIMVLLVAAVFYSWRKNKKITQKLKLQNEEISKQKNQLVIMSAKAEEANIAKVNFFTHISHELRTPLTLIMGPLEDALSSPKLHFTQKNNLNFIQRNAIRLLRLINQLMDFRKIEEGKMKLTASENNITAFVHEITDAFTEIAGKKSISYNVVSHVSDLNIWFDVTMLDKVLFNLLSNAFKFTPEGGSINVTVDKTVDNKYAVLKIEDTGIGMTPEDTAHAFEMFYQGHSSNFKGTGLGLSLSKELIDLHHGKLTVKSKKGEGTCFEINLPLGKDHLLPGEINAEVPALINTYEDLKIYTTDMDPVVLQKEDAATVSKENSVLIIEDSDDLRAFLERRLGGTFEIYTAESGETGMLLAYDIVPDLIISDIILPGQDGLQITETLKQDIRTSHIPIILLTAKASMEDQIEGIKLQADAFIVKPFNLEYLEETIKNLLKNRVILREHFTSELPSESRSNTSSKIDRKFINEFTSLVENNIPNENFSVDDICKEIGISRVQLYRKVKALIGYNVNDYIVAVRMQKAKYLLSNEDLNVSEVAYKVGFASQAYFATVFKTKFGITPSSFKENKT